MNSFSSAMIYFASSALALNLHLEEDFTSPIDASGDWTIAAPNGLDHIKCVDGEFPPENNSPLLDFWDVSYGFLSCDVDGMTAEGYTLHYGGDDYMLLHAESFDKETEEGVWMMCSYIGDPETKEFDSSTCHFEVYGPDDDITFFCYDGECEEQVYGCEMRNGKVCNEETLFDPKQGLVWTIYGPDDLEFHCGQYEKQGYEYDGLFCVADGMFAQGFIHGEIVPGYDDDDYMDLNADFFDEETGEAFYMNCLYFGQDLETMKFHGSECIFEFSNEDYDITFKCYDQECEEYSYPEEFTNEEYFTVLSEDYAVTQDEAKKSAEDLEQNEADFGAMYETVYADTQRRARRNDRRLRRI